jgi:hypothetical protein
MEVSHPVSTISAMITPAILILASGSLILPTSHRLARVMDRIRQIAERFKVFSMDEKVTQEEQNSFYRLLNQSTQSARLLQKALSSLYLAVMLFIGTSVAIGFLDLFQTRQFWIPMGLGFAGALVLFYASCILIIEAKIAFGSLHLETEFLLQLQKQYAPKEVARSNWFKSRRRFFKNAIP